VTCGVNDMKAAWVEIPHADILSRMVDIGKSGSTIFPANGLSDAEARLARLRANAAKARAVLAAKRLEGNVKQKRRRKRFKRVTAEARMKALKEYEQKKKLVTK
jgi:hypothetical protein